MDNTTLSPRSSDRPWYWPFGRVTYSQVRRHSKIRNDEFDLDQFVFSVQWTGENTIANRFYRAPSSSSHSDHLNASGPSLMKSFTSRVLPQSLTSKVEELTQRDRDNKREWVIGVLLCAFAATIVMIINIILTIIAVAVAYSRTEDQGFVSATLYEGKCSTQKNWARGLHLMINILSTIMLAASNYCMQCLSSPSRQNIDDLHPQQEWLDIGIPSLKNLFFIGLRRRVLWMVLLVSSLPIHLMFVCKSMFSLFFGSN